MKHSTIKFSLLLSLIIFIVPENTFGQMSDNPANKVQEFEHMTIVTKQYNGKIAVIYISNSNGYYDEIMKDNLKEIEKFDYLPVFELIDKYSKEGWEIISSNMTNFSKPTEQEILYTYYFLKRQKIIKASM
jgi:hypothetical protein